MSTRCRPRPQIPPGRAGLRTVRTLASQTGQSPVRPRARPARRSSAHREIAPESSLGKTSTRSGSREEPRAHPRSAGASPVRHTDHRANCTSREAERPGFQEAPEPQGTGTEGQRSGTNGLDPEGLARPFARPRGPGGGSKRRQARSRGPEIVPGPHSDQVEDRGEGLE